MTGQQRDVPARFFFNMVKFISINHNVLFHMMLRVNEKKSFDRPRQDSNLQSSDPKSDALSIRPRGHSLTHSRRPHPSKNIRNLVFSAYRLFDVTRRRRHVSNGAIVAGKNQHIKKRRITRKVKFSPFFLRFCLYSSA